MNLEIFLANILLEKDESNEVSQFRASKTEPADERDVRHAQPLVPVPIPDVALCLCAGDGLPGALEPHVVRAIWFRLFVQMWSYFCRRKRDALCVGV